MQGGSLDEMQQALDVERGYQGAPIGLCLVDADLRFLHINELLAEINGKSIEEHLGRTVRQVIPEIADDVEAVYRQVLETGEPVLNREIRGVLPSDPEEEHVWLVSHRPVYAADGACRICTVVKDVTELKRAEALLTGQNQVLKLVATGASLEAILETLILVFEEHAPDMLGSVLLLDLDGKHLRHGAAPHLPEVYNRAIDGVAIGPAVGSCGTAAYRGQQVIARDIGRDSLWADFRGLALENGLRACWSQPIFGPHGRVLGTFAMYYREPRGPTREELRLIDAAADLAGIAIERKRDIAARERAEQALRSIVEGTASTTGEAFFRSLVRHLATTLGMRYAMVGELVGERVHTLAMWDRDTFGEPADYDLAGTPCENVVGAAESCFLPRDVQLLFPEDHVLAEMGAESYLGTPLIDSAGQALGLLSVLHDQPVGEDMQVRRLLAVFASRAAAELERLQLEEQRRSLEVQVQHVQKLESLGVMAGGIAHDFNNFLTGILANIGMACQRLEQDSAVRPMLEEIERSAEHAAELSRQMLAYSGRGHLVAQVIDFEELVAEMAHLLKTSISKKAALEVRLAHGLPAIEGDAGQVQQVVMNLLTNASDAIGEGNGSIALVTGVMQADRAYLSETFFDDGLPEGPYVYLEVADTGCGMDEATQRKVFDPFFTTKLTGRGLGLAVVLGIVRGHRGAIKIDSKPGKGTTIRVLFPVSERSLPAPAPALSAAHEAVLGGGTVLLVDDEENIRVALASALETLGFRVLTAVDGRDGVEMFRRHRDEVRLVLLDMTMPRMSGEEALREMRLLREDVRVLLSSGYNEPEASGRLVGQDVAGFLHKPYNLQTLREKIAEALQTPA